MNMYRIINLTLGKILPTEYSEEQWAISTAQKLTQKSNYEYIVVSNVRKVDHFSHPIINLAEMPQPTININKDLSNWG